MLNCGVFVLALAYREEELRAELNFANTRVEELKRTLQETKSFLGPRLPTRGRDNGTAPMTAKGMRQRSEDVYEEVGEEEEDEDDLYFDESDEEVSNDDDVIRPHCVYFAGILERAVVLVPCVTSIAVPGSSFGCHGAKGHTISF